jgi:hypothetical protein
MTAAPGWTKYKGQQLRLTIAAGGSSSNYRPLQATVTADADGIRRQMLLVAAAAAGSNLGSEARSCRWQQLH